MGHVIDEDGLHTSPDKVKEITDAPQPTNVPQLNFFYYNAKLTIVLPVDASIYGILYVSYWPS